MNLVSFFHKQDFNMAATRDKQAEMKMLTVGPPKHGRLHEVYRRWPCLARFMPNSTILLKTIHSRQ